MLLETLIFDPAGYGFPKPRVPPLPDGLACVSLAGPATSAWSPGQNIRHFTRGRYALREAYRLSGIGPGSTLLGPSYHCRTMLDPALALGGEVLLYPLRRDLSPDLAALDKLLAETPNVVKALLATHFFGIPQQFEGLSAWCAARDITLIEDCSHVFFCEHQRPPGTGVFGEFVVSSPYKFIPSPDGGLLYARQGRRLDDLRTRPQSFSAELRGIAGAVTTTRKSRRAAKTLDIAHLKAEFAAIAGQPSPQIRDLKQSTGCSADYQSIEEGLASLRFSRLVCRNTDTGAVAGRRRENYRRWADALVKVPRCHAMFPQLPNGCIPYMFPLHIEQPHPYFCWLKRLGMPIWRWDSIAASKCSTALDYRLHLLHLPCHQSLSNEELDWMIAAVTTTMGHPAPWEA